MQDRAQVEMRYLKEVSDLEEKLLLSQNKVRKFSHLIDAGLKTVRAGVSAFLQTQDTFVRGSVSVCVGLGETRVRNTVY